MRFQVVDQTLRRVDDGVVASHAKNYPRVHVDFAGDYWESAGKVVVFQKVESLYNVASSTELVGKAYQKSLSRWGNTEIPWELLANGSCRIGISVLGSYTEDGVERRLTTNIIVVDVDLAGSIDNVESATPTSTQYDQWLAEVGVLQKATADLEKEVHAARHSNYGDNFDTLDDRLRNDISTLAAEDRRIDGRVTTLVDRHAADIAKLEGKIAADETSIASIKSDLSTQTGRIDILAKARDDLYSKYDSLKTRVSDTESSIRYLQSQLTITNDELGHQKNRIDSLAESRDYIEHRLDVQSERDAYFDKKIKDLNKRIDEYSPVPLPESTDEGAVLTIKDGVMAWVVPPDGNNMRF